MRRDKNDPVRSAMPAFRSVSEKDVHRINEAQREFFDTYHHLFDPPLQEGVPERLEKIVAAGDIVPGDRVLDVGSGTGILIPIIHRYNPSSIYACDLSEDMLNQLGDNYPYVKTILADVRDLRLPDRWLDIVFINACYPNIVDKAGAFANISRMMKENGRLVISHPMGRGFIRSLKNRMPFDLDEFPGHGEASALLKPYGLDIKTFLDGADLYILVATKTGFVGDR